MKRKLTTMLLAAAVLLTLAFPAFADVMWEPYGNVFYENHREEMNYVDRAYLANGKDGYITLLSAPDSFVEVTNLPNGTVFRVGMTWEDKDGVLWTVGNYSVYNGESWEWFDGWVPMSELALIYDEKEFCADHANEIGEYDGSGDHLTEVCLYSYPGGEYSFTMKESEGYQTFDEAFTYLYTDENGLRWTYLGYYMGRLNSWICIDDPLNEELGTDGPRTVGQVRGGETLIPAADPEAGNSAQPDAEESQPVEELIPPAEIVPAAKTWVVWLIPAVLVVLAAVATALILRKKKKV